MSAATMMMAGAAGGGAAPTFLDFTSLSAGLVRSGTGPYTYTSDTYGRHGHGSTLKMPASTACEVRMRVGTITAGDLRLGLAVGTNNTTDCADYGPPSTAEHILDLGNSGSGACFIASGGIMDGNGAYTAADPNIAGMEWRIARDAGNNFQAAYSTNGGSSWTNFGASYNGGAVDYFVKISVGTGASPGTSVSMRHVGMV